MGMEMICAFTRWPQPIEGLEDPLPPFPDIDADLFLDIAAVLSELKPLLSSEQKEAFEQSYQRIFEPHWSGFEDSEDDEDLGDSEDGEEDEEGEEEEDEQEVTVYSPDDAAAIVAGVDRLPLEQLRKPLTDAELLPADDDEVMEEFFLNLQDIIETFRQAAALKLGVIISAF